ncbi:MAG: type III-B CRISPR module-associated protein Cmr5 [Thiohalorhabdaceae bacterium]
MQTMQQRRAAFALERVQRVADNDKIAPKEFVAYASGLPAMIHMNGLGQAAAFYRSKGGDKQGGASYQYLYDLLSDWLCDEGQPFEDHSDLLVGITSADMAAYMLAQAEAQALMDWVKKFAKAFLGEQEAPA